MQILRFVLLILFLIFSTGRMVYAQDERRIPYTAKCGMTDFPVDDADELAGFNGNLTKFFSKRINWKKLETISGLVLIEVAIDSQGRSCMVGLLNRTVSRDYDVYNLWLDGIVKEMPLWKPAYKNGQAVNNTTILGIYSAVEGHKDFEVDYYRTFSQKTEKIKVKLRPQNIAPADWDELNRQRK